MTKHYDKLGKNNPIHSIESGYGRIKPKLYNGKSKRKIDYIEDLCNIHENEQSTIKQLKTLIARHELVKSALAAFLLAVPAAFSTEINQPCTMQYLIMKTTGTTFKLSRFDRK